ncbi:MAG: hypothetical protein ACXVZV_06835 [Terriglobales bacterium]
MSQRNGDRSRFNRGRKAKIARRLRWRVATANGAEATSAAKAPAAKRAAAKSA